ncbi:hypothetical protein F7734_45895 [Scytonema sp. UIC 10036]|uniref:hypothetical protein n=1 Tax=Scytonema sp. UIC 10036 TaxID=2304196 RepID=UPI0012DAC36C|nr:hypothetical protein [Scytonema sp. UIC 10036]MUG99240.1 hypothetical protein [Scytonema sp. UIC 10036]
MTTNQYSRLFKLTVRFFKYFLLAVFGFAIVCLVSASFGASSIVTIMLPFVGTWFGKLAILLLCLMIVTAFLESLR